MEEVGATEATEARGASEARGGTLMQSLTSHLVLESWQIVLCVCVILVAILSALVYWRQSKRINAALIVAAGLCFCMMIVEPSLPLKANPMLIDGRQSQQHMVQ